MSRWPTLAQHASAAAALSPTVYEAADAFHAGHGDHGIARHGRRRVPVLVWHGWVRYPSGAIIGAALVEVELVPVVRVAPAAVAPESHRWPGCDAPRHRLQPIRSTPFALRPDLGAQVAPTTTGG